jgi:hypothetical protein
VATSRDKTRAKARERRATKTRAIAQKNGDAGELAFAAKAVRHGLIPQQFQNDYGFDSSANSTRTCSPGSRRAWAASSSRCRSGPQTLPTDESPWIAAMPTAFYAVHIRSSLLW